MSRYPLFVLGVVITVFSVTVAQKDTNQKTSNAAREKTAQEVEAERLLKERRDNAQSLLVNLAADARYFTDDKVRARALARIANLLWEDDHERSRSLFRSAWDAAEMADAKSQELAQEDIRQQKARNPKGGYSLVSPPNLRREVLDFVAKCDRPLTEEFLKKYGEQKVRETTEEQRRRASSAVADEATKERFDLARTLVSDGDVERGLQIADPGLSSINIQALDFLAHLREKNASAADQRYAAMLAGAPSNPQSDANTVSLLASYIFSPHTYVVFLPDGSSTAQMGSVGPVANLSADLRGGLFRTAAAILLRPATDPSVSAIDAQYLAIKRMMPLFEQNAPTEMVAALKAQFESLTAAASNGARNRNDQFMHAGIEPSQPAPNREARSPRSGMDPGTPAPDREQTLIDQREVAKTSTERDQMNLQLALLMLDKDDRRGRDYVDKIDDVELRNNARAYIDASIAWKLIATKDVDRALELARTGELTHFQKAWLLARIASQSQSVKHNREQFMSLIDYAATEARRIETSDPDRPCAFFAIANVVFNVDRPAVWEVMDDAIKAANSADKFMGEDGEIKFFLNAKGTSSGHQHRFSDFDVAGIFTRLASEDYEKAVALARGFQNGAPRANAVIAIAKTVLEEKKP